MVSSGALQLPTGPSAEYQSSVEGVVPSIFTGLDCKVALPPVFGTPPARPVSESPVEVGGTRLHDLGNWQMGIHCPNRSCQSGNHPDGKLHQL